jgi:high-affinity nickel-transport protein
MRPTVVPVAALGSERRRVGALGAVVLGLHLVGLALVAGGLGGDWGLVSAATLAYLLGVRHGFDADHVAAIDNTTRQLRHRGTRSVGVGFFFALGHSTVVLALVVVAAAVTHAVPDVGGSTGFVGAGVSGAFLWTVGILNLGVLAQTARLAWRVRAGDGDERQLEEMATPSGILMRLGLGRVLRRVSRSRHMFLVGLLFGLGFETATEVALVALGAGTAAAGLPLAAVLALPVLFAAGMTLVDTLDGIVMLHAYDWALRRPVRKLLYNLTITALSVAVALLVGTVQLLHVAIGAIGLRGAGWDWVAGLDLQALGFVTAGLFVGTWLVALLLWRALDLERRWPPVQPVEAG